MTVTQLPFLSPFSEPIPLAFLCISLLSSVFLPFHVKVLVYWTGLSSL